MWRWLLARTPYRLESTGVADVPAEGPVLLIANHVAADDAVVLTASVGRHVWTASDAAQTPDAAIASAEQALTRGEVVCLFADGSNSLKTSPVPFADALARLTGSAHSAIPVIPVYLDRPWARHTRRRDAPRVVATGNTDAAIAIEAAASDAAPSAGASESSRRQVPPAPPLSDRPGPLDRGRERVFVAVGRRFATPPSAAVARAAIAELGAKTMGRRRTASDRLHLDFVRAARTYWSSLAAADSTGASLTYGRLLIASFALGRLLARRTRGERNVGVMLPATVASALTNIALFFAGRTPVNLNFTLGADITQAAVDLARVRTIVTSRQFLEKAGLTATPAMVFLEDLRPAITSADKILGLLSARLAPRWWLRARHAGPNAADGSSPLATIIFSSGSTGQPKGVQLSHAAILGNIDSLTQIFPIGPSDRFLGILPLFHSFGFTGTFWLPLLRGTTVVYHPNPTDAKTIGELSETYGVTMLISTPTFCGSYLRRCTPAEFARLRHAIVGAEKLREPLASAFREKFGVHLLEGYGCTEMAPVVAVNRVNVGDREPYPHLRPGSVGLPIPGVAARVVDRETREPLPIGEEGLLEVTGANMMRGYLDAPEATAAALHDGWYVTGDVARIDDDGFIFITDRISRFSKIGGEMVPHVRVEDAINTAIGEAVAVVTSVPDAVRGERLVAFYARPDIPADRLWDELSASSGLPRLWIPKRENLVPVDALPTLATGKTDLRRVKEMALARVSPRERQPTPE
ncbi:MAG TPA: AMP-binding protein [Vicinamibacterales bacterium]|nr:AMP-binding protein [Vicinamibacterales bacterium]